MLPRPKALKGGVPPLTLISICGVFIPCFFYELRLHKAFFDEKLCTEIAVARRITAWRSRGRNCAVGGENKCFWTKQKSMFSDELRLQKAFFDESLCTEITVAGRITAWCSRGRNCAVGVKLRVVLKTKHAMKIEVPAPRRARYGPAHLNDEHK